MAETFQNLSDKKQNNVPYFGLKCHKDADKVFTYNSLQEVYKQYTTRQKTVVLKSEILLLS